MALRPGKCFEMSSHFIPLPRSSMMAASSSGLHFDCFFLAGDSAGWGPEGANRLLVGPLAVYPLTGGGGNLWSCVEMGGS